MYYENLTKNEFQSLKSRLIKIEESINEISSEHGYYRINKEKFYTETLAINLNKSTNDNFNINISLLYHSNQGFRLNVIKTFDEGRVRRYHSHIISGFKDISYYEKNINTLLKIAFDYCDNLSLDDLDKSIELSPRL